MNRQNYLHFRKEDVMSQIGILFNESENEFDFETKVKELWNAQQCMNWEDFYNEVNKVCWIL